MTASRLICCCVERPLNMSFSIYLTSFFMSSLYSRHPMKRIVFSTGDDSDIRDSVLEMYLESQSQDKYSAFFLENMVPIFFAQVLRKYSRSASIIHERNQSNNERAMAPLAYINQNFRQISLQELAGHFHHSTSHCFRLSRRRPAATSVLSCERPGSTGPVALSTPQGRALPGSAKKSAMRIPRPSPAPSRDR